ncbi:MAG: Abi family protein [Syntrophales bacterium]|nr:Abi family protein [Syntrophales bacterium]MDY0044960.1 Abi family protein [Syntrophales bacterium]
MKYSKPALSFSQQADLILKRGLVADRKLLISRLGDVNYYRLSAYWYTFRIPNDSRDRLYPGTSFETVWHRYVFDRHLRLIVMDAIERVEVSIRTRLTEHFTRKHGAFGYLKTCTFGPDFDIEDQDRLVSEIRRNTRRSREEFVRHFNEKYDNGDLPLWMAVEIMSFGNLLTLFRHLNRHDKQYIAQIYGLQAKVLESWLTVLNYIRNLCAHHGRLWNRELAIKPLIPKNKNHPAWHDPLTIPNERIFAVLSLLHYMMRCIAPQSSWRQRLLATIEQFEKDIQLGQMGFVDEWQNHAIWRQEEKAPT